MPVSITIKSQSALPFLILLIAVTAISSCSSTEKYYLDPEFEDQKSTSPVLVIPVQKEWFSGFYQHPFGHLKGKDEQAFNSLINPIFSEHSGSIVKVVSSGEHMDDEKFTIETLLIGNIQYDVIVPSEQAEFSTSESKPRFILVLDQFYFRKLNKSTSSSGYAGHEGGEGQQLLYFHTLYVYWDTVKKKPVAWGSSEASVSYSDQVSISVYSELLSEALKKIVDQGPVI